MRCHMIRWSDWCYPLVTSLCSPNEDFGRPNKHLRLHFRSTFKRFVAQILYSHPLKVLRKCSLKCLFILPKSSFGMDKVVTKDHNIPEKPAHRMLLLSFHSIPEKTNTSNHMRCYYLLYHLANLLQMIIAYQKNQHITHTHTCCYYLCESSCKLVTKDHSIPENQHITSNHNVMRCNYLL